MSDNYLDHLEDGDDVPGSEPTDGGVIGLYTWLGATIAIYVVGPGLTLSVLIGFVAAAAVFAGLLVWPGNATLDVDGIELGAPGEWGWIDDGELGE